MTSKRKSTNEYGRLNIELDIFPYHNPYHACRTSWDDHEPKRRLIRIKSTGTTVFLEIQNQRKTRHAGRSHEISDPKTINSPSISLREIALDDQLPVSRTHEGKCLRRFRVRRFHDGNAVTRFRVVRAEGTDHDTAEVRQDTVIRKHKYLPDLAYGVRTRSVKVMRPSEPWDRTPMVFSWTANKTHGTQDVCRILVPPPNFGR